jgi:hypothetical protein
MKRSYGRAFTGWGVGDAASASAAQAGLGGPAGVVATEDLIYANLTCINSGLNTTGQTLGPPVNFIESRSVNILDQSSDYMLSIIRWTSTGLQLPIFIPAIDTYPGTDPNKTTYVVGMTVYTPPAATVLASAAGAWGYVDFSNPGNNSTFVLTNNGPGNSGQVQIKFNKPTGTGTSITNPRVGDSIWLSGVPDQFQTTGLVKVQYQNGFAENDDEGGGGINDTQFTVTAYDTTTNVVTARTAAGDQLPYELLNEAHTEATILEIPVASPAMNVKLTGGSSVNVELGCALSVYDYTQNQFNAIGGGPISTDNADGTYGWATPANWALDLQATLRRFCANQFTSGWTNKLIANGALATVTASGSMGATSSPTLNVGIPLLLQSTTGWVLTTYQSTRTYGSSTSPVQISAPNYNSTALVGCRGYTAVLSGGTNAQNNAWLNGPCTITSMLPNIVDGGRNWIGVTYPTSVKVPTVTAASCNWSSGPRTVVITGTAGQFSNMSAGASGNMSQVSLTGCAAPYTDFNNYIATVTSGGGPSATNIVITYDAAFPGAGIATGSIAGTPVVTLEYGPGTYGTPCNPWQNMTLKTWPANPLDPNAASPTPPQLSYKYKLVMMFSSTLNPNSPQRTSAKYFWNAGASTGPNASPRQAQWGGSTAYGGSEPYQDVLTLVGADSGDGSSTTEATPGNVATTMGQYGGAAFPGAGVPILAATQACLNWAPIFNPALITIPTAVNAAGTTDVTFLVPSTTGAVVGYTAIFTSDSGAVGAGAYIKGVSGLVKTVTTNTSIVVTYPSTVAALTPTGNLSLKVYKPITITGGTGSYDPYVFTRTLNWVPQYPGDQKPKPPSAYDGNMDIAQGSRYYWATDPQHVLNMVNSALSDIWTCVWNNQTTVTTGAVTFPGFGNTFGSRTLQCPQPPAFEWSGGQINLVIPAWDFTFKLWNGITAPDGDGWGSPMYYIDMNPALYALFRGFASEFLPVPPKSYDKDVLALSAYPTSEWAVTDNLDTAQTQGVYRLVPPSIASLLRQLSSQIVTGSGVSSETGLTLTSPAATIVIPQQSSCTDNWAAVSALSFHTSLPIIPEDESAPAQASTSFAPSTSQDVVTSMTDVQLDLSGGVTDWIGKINYSPTAQYRWTLMRGGPIQNMTFSVYWKHRATGKRYLVTLAPGGTVEVKLLLQRRRR